MTEETVSPEVLLLDDDRFLLDMYSAKFIQSGFKAHPFQSADEALVALRGGLKPTAILFDLVMPTTDGFSFLATVTGEKLAPQSVLIALTNQSNDTDKAQVDKLGASRYVVKATMIPSEVVNMVKEEIAKAVKKA